MLFFLQARRGQIAESWYFTQNLVIIQLLRATSLSSGQRVQISFSQPSFFKLLNVSRKWSEKLYWPGIASPPKVRVIAT